MDYNAINWELKGTASLSRKTVRELSKRWKLVNGRFVERAGGQHARFNRYLQREQYFKRMRRASKKITKITQDILNIYHGCN